MPEERHRGVFVSFRDAAVALSILFASPCFGSVPGALVGDCDEDAQVTVNELVSCVNVALGFQRLETCLGADPNEDGVVGVDELVGAVGDSLGNPTPTVSQSSTPTSSRTPSVTPTPPTSKPTQVLSGDCRRPGASGLVGCQAGTTVSAFRCDDRATCAGGPNGRTLIATDDVDGSGSFSIDVGNNENAVLVLEADVGATRYRTITFGSVGPGTTSTASGGVTGGIAETTTIDPISEASVQILDDTARPPDSSETVAGLPLFQVEELDRVNEEVRLANESTPFGGTSDAAAVEIARETADTPELQIDVIRESLNTFIRTDRGCQETGQFPVYGSDEPIAVTFRVDDLFAGEPVSQAAVKVTFLSGLTLLEEDVPTDDAMDGQLVIVGSFTLDATLLLTAEANGVQVTTGCRMRFDGTSPVATPTPTPTGAATATATATRSVGPIAGRHCSDTLASPLAIPDDDLDGVSNTFVVTDDVPIEDLDVEVVIEHSYVGDLVVALTHDDTETRVVLVDRASGGTCGANDISCVFDDDAARFAGFTCSDAPALGGGLVPDGFLAELQGESLAGTWRLSVADQAEEDVGSLVSWCLRANSTAPVVTSISCDDAEECVVEPGEAFAIDFSFRDPDANASAFRITARDSSGTSYEVVEEAISPARGEGMLVQAFAGGFSCEVQPCDAVEFFVAVTDEDGQESPFASILVTFAETP